MVACDPVARLRAKLRISNPLYVNLLSEFYGTALLLVLGLAIVMQFILTSEKMNTWININVGWGFAITFCVYCCSKTSGGHFNPAISLVMVTFGRLSVKHFLLYSLVQTLGAFVGAAIAYGVYRDQFLHYYAEAGIEGDWIVHGLFGTAGCFCSFSKDYVSNYTNFIDQFIGTGLLALFVAVIIDKRNKIPDVAHPLLFGLVLIMIGCAYGMNLGYPINPARDLGPRLFAYFLYGGEVFTQGGYYFWVPIIAPLPGALFGAWSYHFFVGAHIPDTIEDREINYIKEAEMMPLKKNEA
ncbi:aqp-7 [Pristionchus pacificus]|uniref:Aqp-7 n=1 Tax=Pristionchus pacificus TaxID=54126 RepID=A0A2A6CY18_PRIPA|nr:aqp-7 [Pristionchus pacificus]|eukprot:PDM83065.1 aqp-7 [Pristionchus pacificus]